MKNNTESKIVAALNKYRMINDNDKIAVGVSGGKDSVFLLYSLAKIKKYFRKHFEIIAITLNQGFSQNNEEILAIQKLCDDISVRYVVKNFDLNYLIFEKRNEKNPCSLCSKMRKGILNNTAKEFGCNKIALGHNYDDVVQTFFMNMFNGGHLGCFSPVSYLSRKDIYMIRPLIFCSEREIKSRVKSLNLPVFKSSCPVDKKTNREKTENLIKTLENSYPDLRSKIIGILQRNNINDWGIIK